MIFKSISISGLLIMFALSVMAGGVGKKYDSEKREYYHKKSVYDLGSSFFLLHRTIWRIFS